MACSSRKRRRTKSKPKSSRSARGRKGKNYRQLRAEYNRILRAYKSGRLSKRQAVARLDKILNELDMRKNPELINTRPGTLAYFKQNILSTIMRLERG